MVETFAWASVAFAAAGAAFVIVLVTRRLQIARSERRRRKAEERLRPLALVLVDGERVDEEPTPEDAEVLAQIIGRYGRWLRGDARERIAAFFEAHGVVDRELVRLRSSRTWHRAAAAAALGEMASPRAIPTLVAALADDERAVRGAAALSLGHLGATQAVAPVVEAVAAGRLPWAVAGQALLAVGPRALPGLRALEESPDAQARAFAVELIGLLGEAGEADAVAARLRDSAAEVRAKAARALGRLAADDAAAELRRALDDRIPFVRAAAATALGAIGDRTALAALLEQARTDLYEPARAAAYAAARLDLRAAAEAARRGDAGRYVEEAVDVLEALRA